MDVAQGHLVGWSALHVTLYFSNKTFRYDNLFYFDKNNRRYFRFWLKIHKPNVLHREIFVPYGTSVNINIYLPVASSRHIGKCLNLLDLFTPELTNKKFYSRQYFSTSTKVKYPKGPNNFKNFLKTAVSGQKHHHLLHPCSTENLISTCVTICTIATQKPPTKEVTQMTSTLMANTVTIQEADSGALTISSSRLLP